MRGDPSGEGEAFSGSMIRVLTIFDPLLMSRYLFRTVNLLEKKDRLFIKGNARFSS